MDDNSEEFLERAEKVASMPAPMAPYWEGRTFDAIFELSIRDLTTEEERRQHYLSLLALIDSDDNRTGELALDKLAQAFRAEEYRDDPPASSPSIRDRLAFLLSEIERRLGGRPDLLERFCLKFEHSSGQACVQIRDWLEDLPPREDTEPVPADLLAARISYGTFGRVWSEAGPRLMEAVDHDDLIVRACAAYQIGKFCHQLHEEAEGTDSHRPEFYRNRYIVAGMSTLSFYWEWIYEKEKERPGVAGAFWNGAPLDTEVGNEWMLKIVLEAGQEPTLDRFPCTLGFFAHERFSRDPKAVRRILDAGKVGLAVAAATEEDEPVRGMEPVLNTLADSDEPEYVRLASWTLAYNYHRLHPNGARHGFVELHPCVPGCDLLLLFSRRESERNPYAAVLYPSDRKVRWTMQEAQSIADIVFPPASRGEVRPDDYPDPRLISYRRGYIDYRPRTRPKNKGEVTRVIIGYRSDDPWNPVDFANSAAPSN